MAKEGNESVKNKDSKKKELDFNPKQENEQESDQDSKPKKLTKKKTKLQQDD